MGELAFRVRALQLTVTALVLLSCSPDKAGTFEVVFDWAEGEPEGAVWVYARVEQAEGEGDRGTVAEAPLAKYSGGVELEFDQIPYGDGYVIVVESVTRPRHDGCSYQSK